MGKASKHIPELDSLRALAVLMVMAYHSRLTPGGAAGVDVFFVLSGWLITGILMAGRPLTTFFEGRARRLFPALALLLLVYVVVAPLWAPLSRFPETPWMSALISGAYLMNFREAFASTHGPLSHTWSLATEWQFYLVWPFVLIALRRIAPARAATILVLAWALLTVIRAPMMLGGDSTVDMAYFTPLHASGLLLGSALAIHPVKMPSWAGWLGLVLIALTLSLNVWDHRALHVIAIPLAELGAAAVICAPPTWLAWGPLVGLGAISYGVYLWHVPLWHGLEPLPGPYRTVAMIGGSIALAALSYRFIEQPFLRRRDLDHGLAGAGGNALKLRPVEGQKHGVDAIGMREQGRVRAVNRT